MIYLYSIENVKRISYSADLVMDLTKLYRFKGKDFYYEDVFKNSMTTIVNETIYKDCMYASRLLNLNITENRMRLILTKDSNPKTNDERILANLKTVFTIIQNKGEQLDLSTNEFLSLADLIFKGVTVIGFRTAKTEVQFNLLREKKTVSMREEFEKIINLYKSFLKKKEVEATQLATNLFVDVLNTKIFDKYNDFMCLLIYYCLLFKERFNVFKHLSFFEMHYNSKPEFDAALAQASYDWGNGFSKTAPLNRLTINFMLDGYALIESKVQIKGMDKELKKLDLVATSILKLGEIFTKDEIRKANPDISESTINRALDYLKEKEKIRPNGTGRNATWIRLDYGNSNDIKSKQVNIFDLLGD